MFVQKEIVEEVENPGSQISLEEARRISAKYELGGMVRFPVENVEFGRIAAGNGKQVIIQGLREAEHGMIYDEWAPSSMRSSPALCPASIPAAATSISASHRQRGYRGHPEPERAGQHRDLHRGTAAEGVSGGGAPCTVPAGHGVPDPSGPCQAAV